MSFLFLYEYIPRNLSNYIAYIESAENIWIHEYRSHEGTN